MRRLALLLALFAPAAAPQAAPPDREGVEFFEKKIRPVLVEKCYSCHSATAEKLKGGLYVDSRAGLLKGGDSGPSLAPGDPDKSLLLKAIRWTDEDLKMPPKKRLGADVVADFEAWIRRGAPDSRDQAAAPAKKGIDVEAGKKKWAFQPLVRRAPPGPGHPVDAFLGAKPASVDARRLIRRVTFDLIGLPPTPAEIDAFVADTSPDAYEKLLDRLLARPEYGEKWARHWLDLARFAESHGFEQDYDRENAFPYRDFVIKALNSDLPYDKFVQWQVAGDELEPQNPLAWMATGFLGAGAFPTQLTEAEFESARYDELDSMASTTSSAFLALSAGCARCHDHKFDPIPSKDYYRLAATFTTTIRSYAEFALDPEGDRRALEAWEREHAPLVAALEKDARELLPSRFERWTPPPSPWTLLDAQAKSNGGTTFRPLGDGSLLAEGKNPNTDRWTLSLKLPAGTRALRLEAMTDPSLKKGGPGRAENGNFALTDVRVSAGRIVSARADFEQNATNLSAGAAIDADKTSGWAVDPQFGKSHAIVFGFAEPVSGALVVDLEFNLNVHHGIGRPRLSASAQADAPLEGEPQPAERTLAAFAKLDPEAKRLQAAVEAHLAKKPAPKVTKALVTTEGLKPLKHHADERGFPHFYKETYFLARGDVNKKQGAVSAGFLQVVSRGPEERWAQAPGPRTPMRRAALAKWLTDVEQGGGALAARVMANRLWAWHFGRGIVATTSDFGVQGEAPTNPELLDWLASEFVRGGWSIKAMHKLLLTSAAYRQAREPRRLEAEAIRDSLLEVGGLLDRTMYGPGTLDEAMTRRSIYFFIKRSRLIPMMMVFDAPEPLVSQGNRPTTTIAPQALLFMNSPLARRAAAGLAKQEGVDAIYRRAFGRSPTEKERAAGEAFLASQAASYAKAGLADASRVDYCQALLCLNEFVYVE